LPVPNTSQYVSLPTVYIEDLVPQVIIQSGNPPLIDRHGKSSLMAKFLAQLSMAGRNAGTGVAAQAHQTIAE
jgi:hypothetical protein